MTEKQRKKAELLVVKEEMKMAIAPFRPWTPFLISCLVGWALLALFLLPYAEFAVGYAEPTRYSFFQIAFGSGIPQAELNGFLLFCLCLLIIGPVLPLFSRRSSIAGLVFGTVFESLGVLGILIGSAQGILKLSFGSEVSVVLTDNYSLVGFWLPPVLIFLFLFVPYIGRSISTSVAIKRFTVSAKSGKRMLNY